MSDFTEGINRNRHIMWCIVQGNCKYFTWAVTREEAKSKARQWLGGDPDKYICHPLTGPSDRVKIDITLNI